MNTKVILSSLFTVAILSTACKKELEPQESSTATTTVQNPTPNTQVPQPTIAPNTTAPVVQNNIVPQPQTVTTSQPVKVAKGMNPPHGQPNHRCDIVVGAPLNSPPGKPAQAPAPQVTQQPTYTTTVNPNTATPAPVTPVVTAPGMNPPHGQEGHLCSVAVGAPLPKQ